MAWAPRWACRDASYLDTVYKLVACAGRPVMKLSPRKITQPGAKHVYRGPGSHLVTLYGEPAPTGWKPLLIQVTRDGRRVTWPEPPTGPGSGAPRMSPAPRDGTAPAGPKPLPVQVSPQLTQPRDQLAWELTTTNNKGRPV
jgi:nicotinate phosphoribosyltransferase